MHTPSALQYALMPAANKCRDSLCQSAPDACHQLAAVADNLPIFFTLDMQLAAQQAAVDKMWDDGVIKPANSLINFETYSREAGDQAGSSARWQAQGNTTETHSQLVMCCA